MAQTYTLEEAAEKLGISPDELKRRLREDWKHIRSFRDGSSLRFRAGDIDELIRIVKNMSDPGSAGALSSPSDLLLTMPMEDSNLSPTQAHAIEPFQPSHTPKSKVESDPLIFGNDDIFTLAEDPPSPSGIKKAKKGDSDVRLEKSTTKAKPNEALDLPSSDEISLDFPVPSSEKSGKLSSSKSGKLSSGSSKKIPKPTIPPPAESESSEFELTLAAEHDSSDFDLNLEEENHKKKKGSKNEPDSSEFELTLDAPGSSEEFDLSLDSSDEISLGDEPKSRSGNSGINLGNPKDSGLSLEKKGTGKISAKDDSSDEIDFELSLEPGGSAKKIGSGKNIIDDSESEFELTLDEVDTSDSEEIAIEDQKDIFETDFNIPALEDESASEVAVLEESDSDTALESSDFEIDIESELVEEESGSEVLVVDEDAEVVDELVESEIDDVPPPKSKKSKGSISFDNMNLDESISASQALKGVNKDEELLEEEGEGSLVINRALPPAPWGIWPTIFLLPTLMVVFLGAIMGFELVHNLWGYYQTEPPATLVVDQVANTLDIKPKQ